MTIRILVSIAIQQGVFASTSALSGIPRRFDSIHSGDDHVIFQTLFHPAVIVPASGVRICRYLYG
jgi:hypothetical protein